MMRASPNKPFGDEIRRLNAYLAEPKRQPRVREVLERRPLVAVRHWVSSWALVGLGTWASMTYPYLGPICLVLIASRQRALGNLLHDAAHRNLAKPGAFSWLGSRTVGWMLAAPLFEDYAHYRRQHLRHHSHLGQPAWDPDLVVLPRWPDHSSARVYFSCLFSARRWLGNTIGELAQLNASQRATVALWWAVVIPLSMLIFGAAATGWFVGLWILSRMTVFHCLKTFTEICDHVGLQPGSILGFSRNSPDNILAHVIHPLHDGYHLTHHLMPRVPMANLPKAHALLMDLEGYRDAEQCDAYFLGGKSVWTGIARTPVHETDELPALSNSNESHVSIG